ncbi:hypothetical protein INP77_13080 [Methylophilus sp. 13]|uniref:hypothetical protein n=1 Tax=Methylophilus sp. 13 TaxID=2781018 RepID=UPI00188F42F8|nr:hypothetical protein [Methylophilus sp. 13]MBF5040427.1 hypothetical protein [Methylophilus sp. 13]
MNEEVKSLSMALNVLREKLIATPRTAPGFGEMRLLYHDLTNALIVAGDKSDAELAKEIELVSTAVTEEWATSKDKIQPWIDVLEPVISAVGAILSISNLGNPLLALLA